MVTSIVQAEQWILYALCKKFQNQIEFLEEIEIIEGITNEPTPDSVYCLAFQKSKSSELQRCLNYTDSYTDKGRFVQIEQYNTHSYVYRG